MHAEGGTRACSCLRQLTERNQLAMANRKNTHPHHLATADHSAHYFQQMKLSQYSQQQSIKEMKGRKSNSSKHI